MSDSLRSSLLPIQPPFLTPRFARRCRRRVNTYTGGVSASFSMMGVKPDGVSADVVGDGGRMLTKVFVKGKATAENAGEMFDIFRLVLTER